MSEAPSPAPPVKKTSVPWWAWALIALGVCVPMCGIGAAVAVPSFVRYQGRAKQAEAKINLRGIYSAQQMLQLEGEAPAPKTFAQLAFAPEAQRYAYYLAGEVRTAPGASAPALPADIGKALSSGEILAAAVANLDSDDTVDVWVVDARGTVSNPVDDL